MSKFIDFKLSNEILNGLNDMGYESPTSIQSEAIPLALDGKDILGQSKTGSGKTAAFAIPSLMQIDTEIRDAQVLIIAPTRELALQITDEMRLISKQMNGIFYATLYGGEPINKQFQALKKAQVIVGTPGRLMDHIKRRTLRLNHLKVAILDEADEMLSMGFLEDITMILKNTPKDKQTLLFSATMPKAITNLSKEFLNSPTKIAIKDDSVPGRIEQSFYEVVGRQKKQATATLLNFHNAKKAIIFSNTKSMVDDLAAYLRGLDIKTGALHGDMQQSIRIQVLKEFKENKLNVLVATDVAARGIDVDNVDLVINFDIPQSYEYYTHRIGRTGRAGKDGVSLTLISGKQQFFKLKEIMRLTHQDITKKELPSAKEMNEQVLHKKVDSIVNALQLPLHPAAEKLIQSLKAQTHLTEEALVMVLANEWAHTLETYEELQKPSTKKPKSIKLSVPVGKKHKARSKDIARAVERQFKIRSVQHVDTYKQYTTFDVTMADYDRIKESRKGLKFNNQTVQIQKYTSR